MKKITALIFCITLCCNSLFAEADIILMPSLGYNTSFPLDFNKNAKPDGKISIYQGSIGLTSGIILENGFTFLEDVIVSGGGAFFGNIRTVSASFDTNSFIGYTAGQGKKINFNILIGLGFSFGYPQFSKLGVPLSLGVQFYMSQRAGLSISAYHMIAVGSPIILTHTFALRIGPVFRL